MRDYYSAIKNNDIMPFSATWIQLDIIVLSEVNQKEKYTYYMISPLCGIQKKCKLIYIRNRNRLVDTENKLKGKGSKGGIN